MLRDIEIYILLFFIYSFAGWMMESVGGIFKEKKFINRGFLIGPYCPVYGVGVVIITLLLGKYSNDLPVLFVLSTLICGTLEYSTSYVMEKLFNARWWDYHNRKFNINGRICLETLLPFGIGGSVILCIINPFFMNIFVNITDLWMNIITGILCFIFIIDFIISFKIILTFKGEVYSSMDNTEEIGEKVRDKAEDAFMKVESNAILFKRKLRLKSLNFERKVKFSRKKISNDILKSQKDLLFKVNSRKVDLKNRISEKTEGLNNIIIEKKEEINNKITETKEGVENKLKLGRAEFELRQKELTKQIKDKFSNESFLRKRLMNAFPKLEIKNKDKK